MVAGGASRSRNRVADLGILDLLNRNTVGNQVRWVGPFGDSWIDTVVLGQVVDAEVNVLLPIWEFCCVARQVFVRINLSRGTHLELLELTLHLVVRSLEFATRCKRLRGVSPVQFCGCSRCHVVTYSNVGCGAVTSS